MAPSNPYRPPQAASEADVVEAGSDNGGRERLGSTALASAPSTSGTIVARHLAATIDNLAAWVGAVLVGQSLGEVDPWRLAAAMVAAYLGYFFLFEASLARTPGKWFFGLVIVGRDGRPCTSRQAIVRGMLRLLEVNPFVLGAIPAALSIILTKHNQRLGDLAAGTFVVRQIRR